ncbi:hypothetical protein [Hymenobacter sp. YC55]|uniref:hypothetical protein n=1 Tax=Hymenobacter sp. YC55 TaxID=3034019 RepID=UPI0023F82795|nr:hypothetical protein [Hymenobacter sp. YC55]MDF7809907.1 hypothetical protein [Hymenobacter sp. YC55]
MQLREMIQQIVREQLPVQVFPATVLSVNKAEAIIDVQPLDKQAPEVFDVRLRAVDDDLATGLILWPAVDSVVLIGLIGNDINTAFMVGASELESFTLSTAQESLLTWLQDLVQAVQQLVLLTNTGATTGMLPTSQQALQQLLTRLPNLLTA